MLHRIQEGFELGGVALVLFGEQALAGGSASAARVQLERAEVVEHRRATAAEDFESLFG